jgi:peptidoglycan/LPS O-acetylase OafA/YrhL
MSDLAPTRPYRTLDGLRGVAALIVVTRHAGDVFPGRLFPESFLAVDLFFLLSGFVIAHAYEARLMAGLGLRSFLKTRIIRLYPLYLLGLALGAVAYGMKAHTTGAPFDGVWLLQAGVIGVLMLPAVPPLPMGSSALDGPTWTLGPELAANLLYAASLRRLGRRSLTLLIAAGGVGLVACEFVYGSLDGGWSVERFPLIGMRLAFSFFLGVAMFRSRPVRRTAPFAAWACLAVVAAALMLHPAAQVRQVYELVAVIAVFPAIVAMAVRCEPGLRSAPTFKALGLMSYALYVIHQPLGALAAPLLRACVPGAAPSPITAVLFLIGATATAFTADHVYDGPVRRRLASLRTSRWRLTRAWPAAERA